MFVLRACAFLGSRFGGRSGEVQRVSKSQKRQKERPSKRPKVEKRGVIAGEVFHRRVIHTANKATAVVKYMNPKTELVVLILTLFLLLLLLRMHSPLKMATELPSTDTSG